jgi:hypothetical protein
MTAARGTGCMAFTARGHRGRVGICSPGVNEAHEFIDRIGRWANPMLTTAPRSEKLGQFHAIGSPLWMVAWPTRSYQQHDPRIILCHHESIGRIWRWADPMLSAVSQSNSGPSRAHRLHLARWANPILSQHLIWSSLAISMPLAVPL